MTTTNFTELSAHVGHHIQCVSYGPDGDPQNVALECVDCSEVLLDYELHTEVVAATTLREHILTWLDWEQAPLIEVGTVGGQRFIGIAETPSVKGDDEVLGLDQYDNQYVMLPWAQISYAMPILLGRGEQWPAWARRQAELRRLDLRK